MPIDRAACDLMIQARGCGDGRPESPQEEDGRGL